MKDGLIHSRRLELMEARYFQSVENQLRDLCTQLKLGDHYRRTGLLIAAENGRGAIVKTFLDHGADTEPRCNI